MHQKPQLQHRFDALQCCVLIPTYNNEKALKGVLDKVLRYTSNIIVVNDGSTDATATILQDFKALEIIDLRKNRGKGNALKIGFQRAAELNYNYAISMDSDGQHFPDDLPVFLEALENKLPNDPELLVIGSREMDHSSIPEKSNIGNKFSSFWFWVETGIKLKDTQCGYRLYPINMVNSLDLQTSKFELEIEVIVKAAWKGVEVENLPVKVFYDPEERVTHFKPFQDVARISLLNLWFVILKVFYIIPRDLFAGRKKSAPKKAPSEQFSDAKFPVQ